MTDFMGYGSPEKLEQAITAQEETGIFEVYLEGLVSASVCSSLSQEETIARMKARITGITSRWELSIKPFRTGETNPCPCNNHPDTHKHYLFVC